MMFDQEKGMNATV
jgi:phospholipid-transporting ATPase